MAEKHLRDHIQRRSFAVSLSPRLRGEETLVVRSKFRDKFEASLPAIIRFLQKKGVNDEDAYRVTAMIGELGNNAFDHNLGKWPNGFIGCLIAMQIQKEKRLLEIVVVDLGVGFKASLSRHTPSPKSETEAILMGLRGESGRIGEKRGNGLRTIVSWLKQYYKGMLRIQSAEGVVVVEDDTIQRQTNEAIIGVEVYLRLVYGY